MIDTKIENENTWKRLDGGSVDFRGCVYKLRVLGTSQILGFGKFKLCFKIKFEIQNLKMKFKVLNSILKFKSNKILNWNLKF